ncbi:MAG: hypothetical protein LLF94_03400 [Chlamydiales bacterium]|nr:hypothetical protein [Chlamydiales bacterium]
MRLTPQSFTTIANLGHDQVLKCKNVGDKVALEPIAKKSVTWRDRVMAFFGYGPCTLKGITSLFNEAVKEQVKEPAKEPLVQPPTEKNPPKERTWTNAEPGIMNIRGGGLYIHAEEGLNSIIKVADEDYTELEVNTFYKKFKPELFELRHLKSLSFGKRTEMYALPKEIGQLENLESLSVHSKYLQEPIPAEIGNCKKLKSLTLEVRDIEEFPASLWDLENLETLVLSSATLKEIPEDIQKLKNLRHLTIESKNLQLKDVPLHLLPSLQTINVKKWGD